MAFIICYSTSDKDEDWKSFAAYLSQRFYECIYATCTNRPADFRVLASVARLSSDEDRVVFCHDLGALLDELALLPAVTEGVLGDIDSFRAACEVAEEKGCNLRVGTDMHPVLTF